MARPMDDEKIQKHQQADDKNTYAKAGDKPDGLDGKGGNAVQREADHFFERIFGFAGKALMTLVGNHIRAEADQRHKAAQKQIDLFIVLQFL